MEDDEGEPVGRRLDRRSLGGCYWARLDQHCGHPIPGAGTDNGDVLGGVLNTEFFESLAGDDDEPQGLVAGLEEVARN